MGGCVGSKSAGKSNAMKQMPKNWGGMKTSGTKAGSRASGNSGNFGTPKVRMSFGNRNR